MAFRRGSNVLLASTMSNEGGCMHCTFPRQPQDSSPVDGHRCYTRRTCPCIKLAFSLRLHTGLMQTREPQNDVAERQQNTSDQVTESSQINSITSFLSLFARTQHQTHPLQGIPSSSGQLQLAVLVPAQYDAVLFVFFKPRGSLESGHGKRVHYSM
jgi:hypothetical protein